MTAANISLNTGRSPNACGMILVRSALLEKQAFKESRGANYGVSWQRATKFRAQGFVD